MKKDFLGTIGKVTRELKQDVARVEKELAEFKAEE